MKNSSIVATGLFLLLYIVPLGVRPVCIPDETRYAEIPREMVSSGDWIVPHLTGLRYFEKPPLGYWLNAASMIIFGENAFAARFPSALAAGITALLVFLLVRRFGAGHSAGVLSAAILLTCVEVYGVGTFSVLDTFFSMFMTAAMVSFFFVHAEDRPEKRMIFLGLVGAFSGLAFLTKGFIAFALPVVSIVPFMIWEGRLKEFLRVSWVPVVAAIFVALPWSLMIHLREPDFWHYFFWTEHIKRFLSPIGGQHPEHFWFFIPVLAICALPWTALLPAVFSGLCKTRLNDPVLRFAACWLLFPFMFFSASQGKLATYILPCFPPLAILMTAGLMRYLQGEPKRAFAIGASCLAVVVAVCAAALAAVQMTGFSGLNPYGPGETWKWIWGVIGLLAWSTLLALAGRETGLWKKLVLFSTAPLLLMFCANFIVPEKAMKKKMPGNFLMRNAHRVQPDTLLVTNEIAQAVCWFYKRDDILLLQYSGELDYGLGYDDSRNRLLTVDKLAKLIRNTGKDRVILITTAEDYMQYSSLLPKPAFEDSNGNFVFVVFGSKDVGA